MKRNVIVAICLLVTLRLFSDGGGFLGTVLGFQVSSDSVRRVPQGLVLESARIIGLPRSFGAAAVTIGQLGISPSDGSVFQEGVGAEPVTLSTPFGAVRADRLRFSANGLFAEGIVVRLPPSVGGELRVSRLQVRPNGSFASAVVEPPAGPGTPAEPAQELKLPGCRVAVDGVAFDGTTISTKTALVILDDAPAAEPIPFSGLKITSRGLAAVRALSSDIPVVANGWELLLSKMTLDRAGVHGTLIVTLPGTLYSRMLEFASFSTSTGSIQTDAIPEEMTGRVSDWGARLSRPRLAAGRLVFSRASVELYTMMGPGAFDIPEVELDPDGALLASGSWRGELEFLAENGFLVQASAARFAPDGIVVSGTVFFPEEMGASVLLDDVSLAFDGCIVTKPATIPVKYRVAGWDVEADGFFFDWEGLHIPHNRLRVPGMNAAIDLGELSFYPDGGMRKSAGKDHRVEVLLGSTAVSLENLHASEENRLVGSAWVLLPRKLLGDGAILYFDEVDLDPEWGLSSSWLSEWSFPLGDDEVRLEMIRIEAEGISAEELTWPLPGALGGGTISVESPLIDWEGGLRVLGERGAVTKFGDYPVRVDSLAIENGIITVAGEIETGDQQVSRLRSLRFTEIGEVLEYQTEPPAVLEF